MAGSMRLAVYGNIAAPIIVAEKADISASTYHQRTCRLS